jgi:hypothetical protein
MLDTFWTDASTPASIPLACSRTLPVGYCGYHNQDREVDFAGLYPGDYYLADAMKFPPLIRESATLPMRCESRRYVPVSNVIHEEVGRELFR